MKLPQRAQFMRTLIACVPTEVIRQICNKNRRSNCPLRPPEVVASTKIITTSVEAHHHVTKAQIGTYWKRPLLQKIMQNEIYVFFSDVSFEGTVSRLRTMSPASNHRSPQSVYSARLANRPPTSSVYYYSDTLRKGRVGSDSGISVDTPPPKAYHQPRGGRNGRPPPIAQTEVVLQDPSRLSSGKKRRNDTQVWCWWWSRAMKE